MGTSVNISSLSHRDNITYHAPFESLLDQLSICWYFSERIVLLRQVFLLSLFWVGLFPLFSLLLGSAKITSIPASQRKRLQGKNLRQILWRRVIAHIIARRRKFGSRDMHGVGLLRLLVLPQIKVDLLLLFLFPLALLRGLIRQDPTLADRSN